MRTLVLTIALLPVSAMLFAQGVFSNRTNAVLEKVIQDYPNRFLNIRGELIAQDHQSLAYRSTVQLPGSSSCTVSRYTHARMEEYSWTCVVSENSDFEKARETFRQIYEQLRNSIINMGGDKHFILNGRYEIPAVDKSSTHILFSLLPGMEAIKKLRVDLSLQSGKNGWEVTLSVYDHGPEGESQGSVTSN